jgi:hypothetical protein
MYSVNIPYVHTNIYIYISPIHHDSTIYIYMYVYRLYMLHLGLNDAKKISPAIGQTCLICGQHL